MRMCSINCLLAIGVVSASFAASGATQQPAMPKPAPEMAQLAYMEGTWTCGGKMFESPMGPAGNMQSTAVIGKDLNGHFQSGAIKGTMPNMPPFEGKFHATYDAGMKQFVMLWVDNMGGWSQSMSGGWKGDVLVYEGETHMAGQTMKGRETFTKSGPASMKHTWDMQVNGKWAPLGEESCTKK